MIVELVFKLLIGHVMADMALQSDTMSKGKNRHRKPDYVPEGQKPISCWFYFLTGHALIHGGAVWIATGNMWLGLVETALHWAIDFAKCDNLTNPHQDQGLHMLCKMCYIPFV